MGMETKLPETFFCRKKQKENNDDLKRKFDLNANDNVGKRTINKFNKVFRSAHIEVPNISTNPTHILRRTFSVVKFNFQFSVI